MKKIIFILPLLFFSFLSCKNNADTTNDVQYPKIFGPETLSTSYNPAKALRVPDNLRHNSPISFLKAGQVPNDIISNGTSGIPQDYFPAILDHIYTNDFMFNGISIYDFNQNISDSNIRFQWYTGTEGNNWTAITSNGSSSVYNLTKNVILNETKRYYILEASSLDGSTKIYSNVLTCIYNPTAFNQLGYYVYANGDDYFFSQYKLSTEPLGVVCEVDENGKPIKMLSYNLPSEKAKWADANSEGYSKFIPTSLQYGKNNWSILANMVSDSSISSNYPIFYSSVNNDSSWYIPSIFELYSIFINLKTIDNSIHRIDIQTFSEFKAPFYVNGNFTFFYSSSSDYSPSDNLEVWALTINNNIIKLSTSDKKNQLNYLLIKDID